MKRAVLVFFAGLIIGSLFSGCEKNDYQHPMHRANGDQ
jgi:uncharacterized membrane protein